jgi:hypothetical protein
MTRTTHGPVYVHVKYGIATPESMDAIAGVIADVLTEIMGAKAKMRADPGRDFTPETRDATRHAWWLASLWVAEIQPYGRGLAHGRERKRLAERNGEEQK